MDITYQENPKKLPKAEQILRLFEQAKILKTNWSIERMNRALKNSSLLVCAWEQDQLIGFARVLTDFAWIGYLSHLAVAPNFQKQGVGKKLIELIKKKLGTEVSIIVHSAPAATKFYQSVGFESYDNVYILKRKF